MTHRHPNRKFVLQAVLTRSGKINTAGATVNTAVRPVNTAGSKPTMNHPGSILNAYKKGYSQVTIFSIKRATHRRRSTRKKELLTVMVKVEFLEKNNVLFTDTECLVLSSDFKLLDESQVLLRVPRKDNIYSVDLKSVVPTKGLTCLFAKATIDESNLWHRRLGHINFKNMNKLVRGNLVRGLPSKIFENDHSCVACQKGKQHKASCKFDGKADEGYLFGYSVVSKAMRVFNKRIGIVEETLNIRFLENTPNLLSGNKTNSIAGTKDNIVAGQAQKEKEPEQEYTLIPLCTTDPLISQGPKDCEGDAGMKPTEVDENEASDESGKHDQEARRESERLNKKELQTEHTNSSNGINIVSTPVSIAGPSFDTAVPSTLVNTAGPSVSTAEEQIFKRFSPFKNAFTLLPVPNMSSMDNTSIFGNAYDDEDVEEEVDMNNVISSYTIPDTSFTKFHKDHPEDQVIGSLKTPVQTRHMTKITEEHGLISSVHKLKRTNHKDFQNYLFACFLSQMEPKKPVQALKDPSWVEAMQDELGSSIGAKQGAAGSWLWAEDWKWFIQVRFVTEGVEDDFRVKGRYRRIHCCQDSKSVLSSIGGRVSEPAHWISSDILDILFYYDMICFDRSMISEYTVKVPWKKKNLEDMVARSIVFDSTLTAIQSEPTICPPNENELDFRISLDESDDEDYTSLEDNEITRGENGFSETSHDKIIKTFETGDMAPLPAADQRHPWLRYQIEEYTEEIRRSYEQRLETIWSRPVNRVHVLDFEGLTAEMRQDLAVRLRMVYSGEGQQVFVSHAWRRLFRIRGPLVRERRMTWRQFILALGLHTEQEMAEAGFGAYWAGSDRLIPNKGDLRDYWMEISSDRDFLGTAPFYVLIQDPARRLCHRMIAYSISGRGKAPEKVTDVDLFYLCSMDRGTVNVPHLLAKYLFRHAKGRKSGTRLSGGHFIRRLAMHFGLVSDEGLRGLQGPERQQAAAAGASEADKAAQAAEEVAPEIPAPAPA
ncbi:ribonuclease H-like domain-containing protein [Tanacetum coccineum]